MPNKAVELKTDRKQRPSRPRAGPHGGFRGERRGWKVGASTTQTHTRTCGRGLPSCQLHPLILLNASKHLLTPGLRPGNGNTATSHGSSYPEQEMC